MAPPSPSRGFFAIAFLMSPCRVLRRRVLVLSSSRLSLVASRSSPDTFVVVRGFLEGGVGPKGPRASDRSIDRPTTLPTAVARARRSYGDRPKVHEGGAAVLRPCETTKTAFPGSRAPARARHVLCMSSARRRRGCARPPCSDLRSHGSQFVSIHGRRIDDNHRDMTRRVRAPGWRSQAPTIRGRCA